MMAVNLHVGGSEPMLMTMNLHVCILHEIPAPLGPTTVATPKENRRSGITPYPQGHWP